MIVLCAETRQGKGPYSKHEERTGKNFVSEVVEN